MDHGGFWRREFRATTAAPEADDAGGPAGQKHEKAQCGLVYVARGGGRAASGWWWAGGGLTVDWHRLQQANAVASGRAVAFVDCWPAAAWRAVSCYGCAPLKRLPHVKLALSTGAYRFDVMLFTLNYIAIARKYNKKDMMLFPHKLVD